MNSSEAKREKMLSLVEAWRSSGQTQKQFCTQAGIKVATLSYWIAQSRLTSQFEGRFIALDPKDSFPPSDSFPSVEVLVEVLYPNGVSVKTQADLSLLSHLIHLY